MKSQCATKYAFLFFLSITVSAVGIELPCAGESSETVKVTPVAVKVPLNRILLVRAGANYCALKFTKFWTGKTDQDYFARYESCYQDDKTGDFSKTNVKYSENELEFPKPRGIGRFAFSFGQKDILCGPVELLGFGKGTVYFFSSHQEEGDYGIELAPTKWTHLSQINVFDKRLKWYRYDSKRTNIEIAIDDLWAGQD
jgi:hypothetical protein